MVSLTTYQVYRKAGRELMDKVMDTVLSRNAVERSAKLLGLVRSGVLTFDSEEEMAVLFDFVLNDYRAKGKNAIGLYSESKEPTSEVEREVLAGLGSAYTSLFKVVSVSEPDNTLVLRNLLSAPNALNPRDEVQLTDVNLSRTAEPGLLLFLRVVPLRDLSMSSGVMFAFPARLERRLLAGYKRPAQQADSPAEAQRRFVHFYKAHKVHGVDVRYE